MTNEEPNPCLRDDLVLERVDDEAVLLDRANERVHQLNPVAAFVLERCDGTVGEGEIVEEVVERFEVSVERARRDVRELIARLRALDVLG